MTATIHNLELRRVGVGASAPFALGSPTRRRAAQPENPLAALGVAVLPDAESLLFAENLLRQSRRTRGCLMLLYVAVGVLTGLLIGRSGHRG